MSNFGPGSSYPRNKQYVQRTVLYIFTVTPNIENFPKSGTLIINKKEPQIHFLRHLVHNRGISFGLFHENFSSYCLPHWNWHQIDWELFSGDAICIFDNLKNRFMEIFENFCHFLSSNLLCFHFAEILR